LYHLHHLHNILNTKGRTSCCKIQWIRSQR
jgi:hypothetical protein